MKGEKGQLVMVNSHGTAYWKAGVVDGDWLVYTDRNWNKKRLDVSGAIARRIFGVPVWETDDEKNALLSPRTVKGWFGRSKEIPGYDPANPAKNAESSPNLYVRQLETIEGHDAVKTENFYLRILYAPSIRDNKTILILILLGLILIGMLYIGFTVHQIKDLVVELIKNSRTVVEAAV
jgi:hypothetical protein